MARYDYACYDCKVLNEVQHSMSEKPTVLCGECYKPMQRLISRSIGVVWKASGGTRGFGSSSNAPALEGFNLGHREPTLADFGLTNEEGREAGII